MSIVNLSTRKRRPVLKRLSDLKGVTLTADECSVSVAIRSGSIYQANLRIKLAAWEAMGRPERVNVARTLTEGFTIQAGTYSKPTPAGQRAFTVSVSAAKLGLPAAKRKAVMLDGAWDAEAGVLTVQAPPAGWLAGAPEWLPDDEKGASEAPKPVEGPPKGGRVLPDLTPAAPQPAPEPQGKVGLSVRTPSIGAAQLVLTAPVVFFRALGNPDRVEFEGSVSAGLTIRPVGEGEGLKVQYTGSGNIQVPRNVGRFGLSKEQRDITHVSARIADGVLHVAAPPPDWIDGRPEFWRADQERRRQLLAPAVPPTPPRPAADRVRPEQLPIIDRPGPVGANAGLQKDYQEAVARVLYLKRAIEHVTGLKFKFGKGLALILSDEQ
jgi:hypothetical protein